MLNMKGAEVRDRAEDAFRKHVKIPKNFTALFHAYFRGRQFFYY
jgi:hypothetical protein